MNYHNFPYWHEHASVLSVGYDRKGIHVADWDGDGLCDILKVDEHTGEVQMWQNKWNPQTQKFSFPVSGTTVLSGTAPYACKQGWGVGLWDLGVRFADIE